MKKISIITRHFICNYGSILQALATVKYFQKYFQSVEIIDYIPYKEGPFKNALHVSKKKYKNPLKRILFCILRVPDYFISNLIFRKYQKMLLPLTKKYSKLSIKNEQDFRESVICSGSDQLFGPMPYGDIDLNYYLQFSSNNTKISFASSFGNINLNQNSIKEIMKLLKEYDLLYLRENSAEKYLRNYGIDSKTILDPTLMVDRDFWNDFCSNVKQIIKEKYILVYNLHTNKLLEKSLVRIAKLLQLKIIRVSQYFSGLNRSGKKIIMTSPQKFVSLFRDATFVVTDSFHGTVFSTIFNVDFISINPGKTASRIIDFLSLINACERFVDEELDIQLIDKKINWEKVNLIISNKRNDFENEIEKSLRERNIIER